MSKRGSSVMSRIRGGGVVVSKERMLRHADAEHQQNGPAQRKLRVIGLPNRRAALLKKKR